MTSLSALLLFVLAHPARAHETLHNTTGLTDGAELGALLDDMAATDTDVDELVVLPDGAWLLAADGTVESSNDFPELATAYVEYLSWYGHRVDALAIAADDPDTFVLVTDRARYIVGDPVSEATLAQQLDAALASGDPVDELVLLPDASGWALTTGGETTTAGMPGDYWSAISEKSRTGQAMQAGSLNAENRWIVVEGQWFDGDGLDADLFAALSTLQRSSDRLDHVQLGPVGSWVVFSEGNAASAGSWNAIEYGLPGGNIWERMAAVDLPGVSIAIIEDGVLVGARSYGVRQRDTQDMVRTTTPFMQASISKYLTALGIQRLVDDPASDLSLATSIADVADDHPYGEVDYWLTYAPWMPVADTYDLVWFDQDAVTVQRLLSHTASLRGSGYYSFYNGNVPAWPAEPGAGDWLLGLGLDGFSGKPAWSECGLWYTVEWMGHTFEGLRSCDAPGTEYAYRNEGFQVAAAIIEDASGMSYADYMDFDVFGPLGMNETLATFPYPEALRDDASMDHSQEEVKPWRDSGFAAAGAMRGTPWSYAHALFPLLDEGHNRWGQPFLSQDRVDEILTDHDHVEYGLGVKLSHSHVDETRGTFSHGGYLPNRVHTKMAGNPSQDDGIVIMINAGNPPANSDGDKNDSNDFKGYSKLLDDLESAWKGTRTW